MLKAKKKRNIGYCRIRSLISHNKENDSKNNNSFSKTTLKRKYWRGSNDKKKLGMLIISFPKSKTSKLKLNYSDETILVS